MVQYQSPSGKCFVRSHLLSLEDRSKNLEALLHPDVREGFTGISSLRWSIMREFSNGTLSARRSQHWQVRWATNTTTEDINAHIRAFREEAREEFQRDSIIGEMRVWRDIIFKSMKGTRTRCRSCLRCSGCWQERCDQPDAGIKPHSHSWRSWEPGEGIAAGYTQEFCGFAIK